RAGIPARRVGQKKKAPDQPPAPRLSPRPGGGRPRPRRRSGLALGGEGHHAMTRGRLEAFTDGVIAILITIMVLELKVPEGTDWAALRHLIPVFLTYVLSWLFLGIFWNNHHHLFH